MAPLRVDDRSHRDTDVNTTVFGNTSRSHSTILLAPPEEGPGARRRGTPGGDGLDDDLSSRIAIERMPAFGATRSYTIVRGAAIGTTHLALARGRPIALESIHFRLRALSGASSSRCSHFVDLFGEPCDNPAEQVQKTWACSG